MANLMEQHIPKYKNKKNSPKGTKIINLEKKALRKIKKKHKLWKRYLNTKNGEIYQEYCRVRNQVRQITRKAVRNREKEIAKQCKRNPKIFWQYVRSKLEMKSGIPDLNIPGKGNERDEPFKTRSDEHKAEVLNDYFASVFTKEEEANIEIGDIKQREFLATI